MILLPRMLMISGSGKNVGKTTLSITLIKQFTAQGHLVYSIKTSSHLHPLGENEHIILQGDGFDIVEERRTNTKDSSLMLQAGATKSYYIQAITDKMEFAFNSVLKHIPNSALIVCESGGARAFVKPSLFLYLTGNGQNKNAEFRKMSDLNLEFNGKGWNNFHPGCIHFNGEAFKLKQK